MICADSSVWIEALRDAESRLARHLAELVDANAVVVPLPVRLELLAGAPRRALADLLDAFGGLAEPVPERATWERVESWIGQAVEAGQRFGLVDLLIGATAAEHGASVWSLDADFGRMQKLGFVELYAAP